MPGAERGSTTVADVVRRARAASGRRRWRTPSTVLARRSRTGWSGAVETRVVDARGDQVLDRRAGHRRRDQRAHQRPRDRRVAVRKMQSRRAAGIGVAGGREAHRPGSTPAASRRPRETGQTESPSNRAPRRHRRRRPIPLRARLVEGERGGIGAHDVAQVVAVAHLHEPPLLVGRRRVRQGSAVTVLERARYRAWPRRRERRRGENSRQGRVAVARGEVVARRRSRGRRTHRVPSPSDS